MSEVSLEHFRVDLVWYERGQKMLLFAEHRVTSLIRNRATL